MTKQPPEPISYCSIATPFGPLLLAATDLGLVRVAFDHENHDRVLAQIAEKISPQISLNPTALNLATRELEEYFAGHRRQFSILLDRRLSSGFRRVALDCLLQIDYGHTASYSEVAFAAGRPKAVRAVGSACATNPLPIIIPCHRIIRSNGDLGQYGGGIATKQALLQLEAATLAAN